MITLQQGLQKNLDETELAILAQARLNRELQQGLMGVRLVPLGNLADRFYRVVRQTAKELDKKANLELKGTRTSSSTARCSRRSRRRSSTCCATRSPTASKPAPSALARGQARDRRDRDRGRAATATRSCSPSPTTARGLDFARIREKAVAARACSRPDVELPEAQLAQFIFTPGLLHGARGDARSPAAASAWTW